MGGGGKFGRAGKGRGRRLGNGKGLGGAKGPGRLGKGRLGKGRGHRAREFLRRGRNVASELMKYLVTNWAFGWLSAPVVQRIASLAESDHKDEHGNSRSPSDLQWVANIGTAGANEQNCQRDLERRLQRQFDAAPQPSTFKIPMKGMNRDRFGERIEAERTTALLDPSEWFAYLYH